MTTFTKTSFFSFAFCTLIGLSSCELAEDPGPLQPATEYFELTGFTGVSVGHTMIVDVQQDEDFSIRIKGDQRNLEDLEVFISSGRLVVQFDDYERRKHDTYVYITMPSIDYLNFSGATTFSVEGFDEVEEVDLIISGASNGVIDLFAPVVEMNVSGASILNITGETSLMKGEISGASSLNAFEFFAAEADMEVSGASSARITVANDLIVNVTGASTVIYRGNPSVTPYVSDASTLRRDN